ncbi:NAD-dependent DNA ligase LigA [Chlamydiia bacterium]|nr:NAD-dependent DNA ligase LigA [Chlamydiia bacterium]
MNNYITEEHKKYLELKKTLNKHNHRYFVENQPTISDRAYDKLLKEFQAIETKYPEWINDDSPTRNVGSDRLDSFQTVNHYRKMLSFDKVFSVEDVVGFFDKFKDDDYLYSAEVKIDGCAISLHYENGLFVRAITRGDGEKGDDVTQNVLNIASFPRKLSGNIPQLLEVRGEIYMGKTAFAALNNVRESNDESLFANPRNATSGSLKLLDAAECKKRHLALFVYAAYDHTGARSISSTSLSWQFLREYGFPLIPHYAEFNDVNDVSAFIDKMSKKRSSLDFGIDGVMIKLDSYDTQDNLGYTGQYYRWGVAYKFPAEQGSTEILDITLQIGRTGVITPVAELKPVLVDGSVISRATLHNMNEIERKDIRIGDIVTIEKGGDIIPKVVSVDLSRRSIESRAWTVPTHCHCCQSVLKKEQVALRCPNWSCPQRIIRRLAYFCSKEGLDIAGMGIQVITKLVENGYVSSYADIFKLDDNHLSQLEGFKEKSIRNTLNAISVRTQPELDRFIVSLGIPHLGKHLSRTIARYYQSWERLLDGVFDDAFTEIDGMGEISAESIRDFFKNDVVDEIRMLIQSGCRPIHSENVAEQVLINKTIVLTGAMRQMMRNELKEYCQSLGARVSGSISKKTTFLVYGEKAGSKLAKATSLGVKCYTETEFMDYVNQLLNK